MRTSFFSIRYATRKGVPEMTSSRVPATRPFRPANGWRARISTESQMWFAISVAAASSSAAMYSCAAASCCVAGVLHQMTIGSRLLGTAHFADHFLHIRVRGKLSFLPRAHPLFDHLDVVFVQLQVTLDRFVEQISPVPIHRLGQRVQSLHCLPPYPRTDCLQRTHSKALIIRLS